MSHRRFTHFFRRRAPTARIAAALVACSFARPLHAQTPNPPASGPTPAIVPYRSPSIALVEPLDGGVVYQDRPVVVLRFAIGEATDPIDASSFTIDVDGADRTKLFQTSASEAWGPLGSASTGEPPLGAGPHHISARICSSRGACATTQATVSTIPAATSPPANAAPAAGRSLHQRLLDAALSAARRILNP
ncbi:MAG: hypothetical protein ACJ79K_05170 [Gemmatimonadaceae bacterium]